MRVFRSRRLRTAARSLLLALVATIAVGASSGLVACGSADSAAGPAASPVKTAVVKVLPRDASAEPPWNGRYVQVNVRAAEAASMKPTDWRVFVNGKEPDLDKAPSILPFSPTEAVVSFMFSAPYGDPGTYEFRVVYAPKTGQKAEQTWEFAW
jgi:hypothetical protein